jgi:hypothetical protein
MMDLTDGVANAHSSSRLVDAVRGQRSLSKALRREVRGLLSAQIDRGEVFRLHPLGFLRIRLGWTDEGVQLLLHAWSPGTGAPGGEAGVHMHKFDLWSRVLGGAVEDSQYLWAKSSAPDAGEFRLFEAQVTDRASALLPSAETGDLRLRRRTLLREGMTYGVPAGVYHSSATPDGAQTVTLIATAPATLPASLVAVRRPGVPPRDFVRERVSASADESLVAQCIEYLD